MPERLIVLKVQDKLSKPSVGKRKNVYLENGDSIHPYSQTEQYPHLKQPFGASSSAVTSQDSIHKHTPNMDSDSLGCLDIRTKLCIRDSLYRLAKSTEQRHTDANVNGQLGDDIETRKALMTQDADRCTGFMDVETNTNPIDRSIAHLLFHRPSDASIFPRIYGTQNLSSHHGLQHRINRRLINKLSSIQPPQHLDPSSALSIIVHNRSLEPND
ncbi:uncharacterized protein DS421_3g103080 [Arachis hypogaea]|nr:uncharacterized protein DS421_3g103080 [Arachis hypogaea]